MHLTLGFIVADQNKDEAVESVQNALNRMCNSESPTKEFDYGSILGAWKYNSKKAKELMTVLFQEMETEFMSALQSIRNHLQTGDLDLWESFNTLTEFRLACGCIGQNISPNVLLYDSTWAPVRNQKALNECVKNIRKDKGMKGSIYLVAVDVHL
jgi:hypothetical protein